MPIHTIMTDSRVPVKIWSQSIEEAARKQLYNTASLPFVFKHVAAMPDVHLGIGATVGSVIATQGAIIPAAVGVDIGCGMCAVKLPFQANEISSDKVLRKLRNAIERSIPVGREPNRQISDRAGKAFTRLGSPSGLIDRQALDIAAHQLGTLGSGNHFIELCIDTSGGTWIMLHSGSRNIGKRLAEIHIEKAKWMMKEITANLPDPDLAYFLEHTKEFQNYLKDLQWAQNYAKENRNEMMLRVLKDISFQFFGEDRGVDQLLVLRVDCHHNYVEKETHFGRDVWVTRKGAVRAQKGDLGIIPGSMGTKSYIVQGLGNPESFHSCSHGAGRKMSRSEAKRRFTSEDLRRQTAGVECRKDSAVIDEIPAAYKNIEEVMSNQTDLIEIVSELKQVLCIKG